MLEIPGLSRRLDNNSEILPTMDPQEHVKANYAHFIPFYSFMALPSVMFIC